MKNILLLLLLIFVSCSEITEKDFKNYFNEVKTIELKSMNVDLIINEENFFSNISEMIFIDDLLIISDYSTNFKMKLVNLKDFSIKNFGKKGRGPNELKAAYMKFSMDYTSKHLYVSDLPNYFIYSVDSLKIGSINPISNFEINRGTVDFFSSVYCKGKIVGGSIQKRFALYNIKNKNALEKFNFNNGGALSNQANFYNHPSENKVAYFQFFSETMGILTVENDNLIMKEHSWWQNNDHEITNGGRTYIKPSNNRRICFLNASTTKNYIYSLYSGKLLGNNIDEVNESLQTDFVYVFDWQGNPLKKYKLSEKVQTIAVDENNNILYAICLRENIQTLIKFKLI